MGEMLNEAEINENVNSFHEEDIDRAVVECFNWNSLHLAASRGQNELFQNLLQRNPELADALDSQQRSLLHLASANGHIEIVRALTKVRPEMCLAQDRDGANPFHVAAMKGKVEVLDELFQANSHAARARVDKGERDTVLHLCIKYNQLVFLEQLLHKLNSKEFVSAKDDAGNTILHLAVVDRRFEIIKHLLNKTEIDVNAVNARKHTAMDIILLQQRQGMTNPEASNCDNIEDLLRKFHAKREKDLLHSEWLSEKINALIIVAVLMATIAFQAGVTPPGGVWQDNLDGGRRGGEAVMAYNYPKLYHYFLRSNTIGFVASLSTIMLLISGLPLKKRRYVWMLVVIMCLTITSMAFTYAFSIVVITPKWDKQPLSHTIVVAVVVWCSMIAILLLMQTIGLIANIVGERRSRNKAMERLRRFGHSISRRELKLRLNPVGANEAKA